jgi:uncharacterized protein YcbK (DUF882 family)|tara:strand:+ start:1824 stop:2189 length:366 start_codon:yes stop_codon:yes gene_type:complete
MEYKYFSFDEFDCPTQSGSGYKYMDREFIEMLDEARDIARIRFKILSGYRTPLYNTNHFMASTTSTHLIGRAAHIECVNANKRLKIVEALSMVGFKRLGLGSKYIHVDNDDLKPNMIWFLR